MRNPFRITAAQRAVSDEEFVRLFGAGALDLLDGLDNPWDGLVFLRSAPGGGKTSFLRLLTPRPLRIASLLKDDDSLRSTYDALRERGAISAAGPDLLGVFVTFHNEYLELEDIDRAGGLFRALLNARIVIATVRALLQRSDRAYPDDLESIQAEWGSETPSTIPKKANGRQLFDWASEIENRFFEILDALDYIDDSGFGHTRLDALGWFAKAVFRDANGQVDGKRVLLLDDLQYLAEGQRRAMKDMLTQARENCGIWVAERMEALSHQELLSEGALQNRDYEGVIQLENKWAGRHSAYTKFVSQIADLRARRADGFADRDLFPLIADRDDEAGWALRFRDEIETIRTRVGERVGGNERYRRWFAYANREYGTVFEHARRWRATEILIERDLGMRQSTFNFDVLTDQDYEERSSTGLLRAADLFVRNEIKAPCYFGKEMLASVSSNNVAQYVDVMGDLFEEVSAAIEGPRTTTALLSAERQDQLVRSAADKRWNELPRRLPHGYNARRFLEAVCKLCEIETYRPTAPYAPGVTGFAITMDDRERLIGDAGSQTSVNPRLRDILTTLVAHNLLSPRLDARAKGRSFVVSYLNRLICARFNLPLTYGGWREKPLKEVSRWLEEGAHAIEDKKLI